MGLLLALLKKFHLSMSNDPDDTAVADHLFEVFLNGLAAEFVLPFLACLGKGLLLALIPDCMTE